MFAKFARFISRYWIAVLIAWVAIPAVLYLVAPKWEDVAHDGDFAYLPDRLTSVKGAKLLEDDFPELDFKSNVVLVVARPGGELTDKDEYFAAHDLKELFAQHYRDEEGAAQTTYKAPLVEVMTHKDDFIGKKLASRDDQGALRAVLVVLQLKTEFMAVENMAFMEDLHRKVQEVQQAKNFPAGLQVGVTGSAAVGTDLLQSQKESIDYSKWTTIFLVIAILLIVYRSPGLVLVPLLSIAVSFLASLFLIALVGRWADQHEGLLHAIGHVLGRDQFDFHVFTTTHIFIVVVLFGAATDYCLFLVARNREELERGLAPRAALEEALGQTGHALTASAMTTILGLGVMIFADFGKYRSGGPTIAISLVVALAACLTMAPALLRALGRTVLWEIPLDLILVGLVLLWAFGRWILWGTFGSWTLWRIPLDWIVLGSALLWGLGRPVFWLLRPKTAAKAGPEVRGQRAEGRSQRSEVGGQVAIRPPTSDLRHPTSRGLMGRFWNGLANAIVSHPGLILLGSLLVLAVPAYYGTNVPMTYDMFAELKPECGSVKGMDIVKLHFPVGKTGPITVLAEFESDDGNFDTQEQRAKICDLTRELSQFVYVDSKNQETMPIREVSSWTNPLGEPSSKKDIRLWHKNHLSMGEFNKLKPILEKGRKYFLSSGEHAGKVARFDLVCDYDPFSPESMRLLGKIDEWLKQKTKPPNADWHGVEFNLVGVTAGIRDLDAINKDDTAWVSGYVALAVLIVLIFLLRRPLLSFYLIATVVFGYLVTLGLTHLFFSWYFGSKYHGLDWKLKIFLFVILVAVGEDYNIYLVTRVLEEQRRRGPIEGLRVAVVRTGGIITSCGVIMAGTFGSMATGTLSSMIELGFALSLGVLLDTFIIRTILVPAFMALMARWWGRSVAGGRGDVASPHFEAASENLLRRP